MSLFFIGPYGNGLDTNQQLCLLQRDREIVCGTCFSSLSFRLCSYAFSFHRYLSWPEISLCLPTVKVRRAGKDVFRGSLTRMTTYYRSNATPATTALRLFTMMKRKWCVGCRWKMFMPSMSSTCGNWQAIVSSQQFISTVSVDQTTCVSLRRLRHSFTMKASTLSPYNRNLSRYAA